MRSHLMQASTWADPAAIAELLDYNRQAGALPADELAAQRTIRDEEVSSSDGRKDWDYSPCVLARTYDHFAGGQVIGDQPFADPHSAGLQITNAVYTRRQPLIALIDGGLMYVVIVGVILGPDAANGPPAEVVVDDPWPISQYGPNRNDGAWPALGPKRQMSWDEFLGHFTPVPANLSGIWSGSWVLIGPDLSLTC